MNPEEFEEALNKDDQAVGVLFKNFKETLDAQQLEELTTQFSTMDYEEKLNYKRYILIQDKKDESEMDESTD